MSTYTRYQYGLPTFGQNFPTTANATEEVWDDLTYAPQDVIRSINIEFTVKSFTR